MPEIVPGVEGTGLRVTFLLRVIGLKPQELTDVTETVPEANAPETATKILVVPAPLIILQPTGRFQLYEDVLAVVLVEYVTVSPGHNLEGPTMESGDAGKPDIALNEIQTGLVEPQVLDATTHNCPPLKLPVKLTTILFVPCPEITEAFDGADH